MNRLKGWKTVAFNVATMAAALLAWPGLADIVAPQWIVVATGAANLVLRYLTTTPIGASAAK
jgi:hypothetical protein